MRLYVYLLEGRGLGAKDSYVKLQVGKYKSKSRVLKNTDNPLWNEEFFFRVHDLEEELVVSVYKYDDHEQHGFFIGSAGDLMGRVKIPVWSIVAEENQNLPPTWFSVERPKSVKSSDKDCGKLLLALSLRGKDYNPSPETNNPLHSERMFIPSHDTSSKKTLDGKHLMKALAGRLEKFLHKKDETPHTENSSELSTPSNCEDFESDPPTTSTFDELIELYQSKNENNREIPDNLPGGILLDQTYEVSPKELNTVLFGPDSDFRRNLAELEGTTDMQESPWKWESENLLKRVVTFTKAASKLVKAVKATEEQTYVKADVNQFAVLVSVSTPDVPYGNTFKVELLYKITSADELSSRLVISYAVNFSQSTMMKGMIENGARQGLKESFDQFNSLLSEKFRVVKDSDVSDKDQMLATMDNEHQSDSELAVRYFWNFTVVSTLFLLLYVVVHVFLYGRSELRGLEFDGLDLPDSFGEIITCGLLVLQLERVYFMISHFVEARLRRGSDHGVKAQGDGWVITVALVEGANLPSMNSGETLDPYVVFTCNGKTRTSSVKLQTLDPQWNEILEFDAVEEPPSVLDVEVFDFEGPFDQASSLGHAEINFLKHTAAELADLWVPLDGKLAQSSQSKLHLRIFLDNNNGVETIREYLSNLEKEVGKKLNLRSPHRNSTFQKIFGLPPEEFLISDFSCSLKRKMPLQGRLFLSSRIVGFYANLFGHKTRFFFLWKDIEDIQVLPPSLSTVGSPSIEIIMHKGRGFDARHGAKILDEHERLHFHFHSFVSFNDASRTIIALWRTRTLEPDQKAEIADEQVDGDDKPLSIEDTGSYLVVEDAKMTKVHTIELPLNPKSLMKMFDGGELEHKVMSKSGCLNYATTVWENVTSDVQERRVSYKFSRRISIFGGEVTCTQQKSPLPNSVGWVVNESMTLHNVPFGDHFRVQFKYRIEQSSFTHSSCKCDVYIGVVWLRSTKFDSRITRNVIGEFTNRSKEILQLVEREILLTSQ
ncbi:hypothetical protein CASFOL_013134 [Castilleja foliolosa]|uniref:C2 and GRAM domain-containing protein n=1 Tax=Castilleja foliolosa TaxID=1961234 RepID=A0ABD3DMP7_9LAMI